MADWIDFKTVKGLATMAGLLAHYGVRFQHKTQLYLPCPLPSHTSKSSGSSFSVNLERNIWSCKSASCIAGRQRTDKDGGNCLDFVVEMERCDLKTAAVKIVDLFGVKPETREMIERESVQAGPDYTLIDWLEKTPQVSAGVRADNPSPLEPSAQAQPVKGHMKEVDVWFDGLISDPPDWKKIKNAVKARLIDSYKNGLAARS